MSFRSEEASFRLNTSIEIIFIYFLTIIINFTLLVIILDVYESFFNVSGLADSGNLESVYYQYLFKNVGSHILILVGIGVFLFLMGGFIAKIILRPFNDLGEYCENAIGKRGAQYTPSAFSELRFLTNFTSYFFQYIDLSRKEGRFLDVILPEQYIAVHKPKFEYHFFLHFMLFFLIICSAVSVSQYFLFMDINLEMIDLFTEHLDLRKNAVGLRFMERNSDIFIRLLFISSIVSVFLFGILALRLYNKVRQASFGVFATFRAFLRGKYHSRIHLIGHNFIRVDCRLMNKFLDTVEKELVNSDKNVQNSG